MNKRELSEELFNQVSFILVTLLNVVYPYIDQAFNASYNYPVTATGINWQITLIT